MNDEILQEKLNKLAHNDKSALADIYEEMKIPVYTVIMRMTNEPTLAEDIMQEVFLKLWETPPGKDIRKPRAYIFQMAHNMTINVMTKRSRSAARGIYEEEVIDRTDHVAFRLDLKEALSKLGQEERQIVILHLNGGLKFREIASIVGSPIGTVLWKYQNGLKKLRKMLEEN